MAEKLRHYVTPRLNLMPSHIDDKTPSRTKSYLHMKRGDSFDFSREEKRTKPEPRRPESIERGGTPSRLMSDHHRHLCDVCDVYVSASLSASTGLLAAALFLSRPPALFIPPATSPLLSSPLLVETNVFCIQTTELPGGRKFSQGHGRPSVAAKNSRQR